ncbi:MAG: ester cyclase [Aurantibacter sp.]
MGKTSYMLLVFSIFLISSCKDQKWGSGPESIAKVGQMDETIKIATQNYIKAWSDNDFDLMKLVTAVDFVREANGETTSKNHAELNETMKFWHTAMPDLSVFSKEIIVNGSRSYTKWTVDGTNTGMYGTTPPTGKKGDTQGFTVLTFNEVGKIVHEEVFYDLLGVVEDWGYSVTPPIME